MRRSSKMMAESQGSAPLFAALGDQTRLRLVSRLCDDGPLSIVRLTTGSKVTRQAVTKHLRVMEEAGLVRSCRRGREHVWELDQQRLAHARRYLDLISERWDDALGRLRELVEEET
ncbi:MAG TPA: metalloregulator ArsR/SmtB family transcription factor [Bryobacteraceae bacterium]|nr:metalloregulator ArsR/SmtB family transcription factor [Bryobacteraceae bacterium]HTF67550.1 metalloregulator ArsR/SmtB family transcription factor [Edaphobacter sp.]